MMLTSWGVPSENPVIKKIVANIKERIREEEETNLMRLAQWQEIDGLGYTAMGEGVGVLPPGIYDLGVIQQQTVFVPIRARTDELIRFPETASLQVVEEIEKFWEREQLFIDHGLPYKRGMLLWGPPGSGKSCTLQLLARDVVERNGHVLLFGGVDLFVSAYRQLRAIQPTTPLVVFMEDLDTLLEQNNESKILNLLDGAEELYRVVFIATTNYPQKLGQRIVNRPSRFDKRIKIRNPNAESRRIYLKALMMDGDEAQIDVERAVKDTDNMSLAHVKELFVATCLLGADYTKSLKAMKSMTEKPSSTMDDIDDDEELNRMLGGGYV